MNFCLKVIFLKVFWYILKWNDGEPTKFGLIFTNLTFLSWVQFFRSNLIIFSPNIHIVNLVDTHMYLQPCTFYDSQGTEALPSFWTFQRGIHSRTLACLKGGIQQLRGPNFTQFWTPPPSSGQTWTFHILSTFCHVTPVDFLRTPFPLFLST